MGNFVHIDDESSEEYALALLEDIKELLNSMTFDVDEDYIDLMEEIIDSQDVIDFHGFESLHKKILEIEEQLLYSSVQIEAQDSFDNLKKLFEIF